MIAPHGGRLVSRIVEGAERERLLAALPSLPSLRMNKRETADFEMIATGAMSPLEGFMGQEDYESVLERKRFAKGLPWTIPITLSTKGDDDARGLAEGCDVALLSEEGDPLGVLHLGEKFRPNKEEEASRVLLTTDGKHPGVQYLQSVGSVYLGGRVSLLHRVQHREFDQYRLDPRETRVLFRMKGWKRIVAFQTRNPIHRAHEYLQKCALEQVDALLVHPLMGETKADDIPGDVRLRCYEALLKNYYPKDRVALSVFPAAMRYAGPREAIFHALVRKNYGCTHMIIGRDHAGVGSYYGSYDAHFIFDEFPREEIDITPMFFDNSFFCRTCQSMASSKTCPHGTDHHVALSGTKVREMLGRGEVPPKEFTRPEVAKILIEHFRGRDGAAAAGSPAAAR